MHISVLERRNIFEKLFINGITLLLHDCITQIFFQEKLVVEGGSLNATNSNGKANADSRVEKPVDVGPSGGCENAESDTTSPDVCYCIGQDWMVKELLTTSALLVVRHQLWPYPAS